MHSYSMFSIKRLKTITVECGVFLMKTWSSQIVILIYSWWHFLNVWTDIQLMMLVTRKHLKPVYLYDMFPSLTPREKKKNAYIKGIYSQISYRGHCEQFQNWNFLHLFVALLQEA